MGNSSSVMGCGGVSSEPVPWCVCEEVVVMMGVVVVVEVMEVVVMMGVVVVVEVVFE